MNTYFWSVNSMTSYPTYESQTDVVFQVVWSCTATSDQINPQTNAPYKATFNSIAPITYIAGSEFTPYPQLTQTEVIGWVQTYLGAEGVVNVQASCDKQIDNQILPPAVTLPLPWVSSTQAA